MHIRSAAASLTVLLLLLLSLSPAFGQNSPDIDTLKARLYALYLAEKSPSGADGYLTSQAANGSWSDINYADQSQTAWNPVNHLSRIYTMCSAYNTPGNAQYRAVAMKTGILNSLTYWYSVHPRSTNWWYNDIGKQLNLCPIGILMEKELTAVLLDSIKNNLQTAPAMTGANRDWISVNVVVRGCLEYNAAYVTAGINGIKETVVITSSEGVQCEYSFYQHGNQLYNAGYGLTFIGINAKWAWLGRGTQFAYSQAQIDILTRFLLEGDQWMVRGSMMDFGADGREISRAGQGDQARSLVTPLDQLSAVNPPSAAAFTVMKNHIQTKSAPGVNGNKHFWRGDFAAHHRDAFYSSVKICSRRTIATEAINSENLRGYWLALGVHCVYRRGDEYRDIFPVWDWARLPGVTNPAKLPPMPASTTGNPADFCGGVSNGRCGVAAMTLNRDSTAAKKAWFFFDREIAALGAGITSIAGAAVNTTLNQCLLKGQAAADGAVLNKGEQAITARRVWHDSIGYVFFSPAACRVRNDTQNGSWRVINTSQSATALSAPVFKLWLDHGVKPANAAYSYVTIPGLSDAVLAAYAAAMPVSVIANADSIQAVYNRQARTGGCVFYKPGSIALSPNTKAAADRACIMFVAELADSIEIAVSNPLNTVLTVNVGLQLKRGNKPDTSITVPFQLPDGQFAGGSVIKKIYTGWNISGISHGPAVETGGRTLVLRFRNGRNPFVPVAFMVPAGLYQDKKIAVSIFSLKGELVFRRPIRSTGVTAEIQDIPSLSGTFIVKLDSPAAECSCSRPCHF